METWMTRIVEQITVDDLPESYRDVAAVVGVQNAILLSEALGGLTYYFQQLDKVLMRKRDQLIRDEFDGANHRPLARKYGLSEVWIREIVQRARASRTGKPAETRREGQ